MNLSYKLFIVIMFVIDIISYYCHVCFCYDEYYLIMFVDLKMDSSKNHPDLYR